MRDICVTNDNGYVPFVIIIIRFCSFIMYHRILDKTKTCATMDQWLLTLPNHLSLSHFLRGSYCSMFNFLYNVFVDNCFSFCPLHCRPLVYGFRLPFSITFLDYLSRIFKLSSCMHFQYFKYNMCKSHKISKFLYIS